MTKPRRVECESGRRSLVSLLVWLLATGPALAEPPTAPSGGPTSVTTSPAGSPNPGEFVEGLVRAQAERALPPLLPVVRLDKPEFVFSGADPVVAEGVQQWLATLKSPHDQYGNYRGSGYVSSFRPTSVSKGLLDFLAKFLEGKRLVAIHAGGALAAAAQQQRDRLAQIEAFVRQRREQSSLPPIRPTTGTGPRENVPILSSGGPSRPATPADAPAPITQSPAPASPTAPAPAPPAPPSPPPTPSTPTWSDKALPVLQARCTPCHGDGKNLPRFASSNANTAFESLSSGNGLVDTASPANSRLLQHGSDIPAGSHGGGNRLGGPSSQAYQTLLAWIQGGAKKD